MKEGINSEILQKIMDEHPLAPDFIKWWNKIAIERMKKIEKEQGEANIKEAVKIITE